ncbi:tripartite motif-containing protein 6 isoform X2 [Oryzias melastigma]|uniref:tripartite motif-containing protein 6 isoform X2 n=1 Tax=Oryzias melastigma TaxID=30732 RepID=UPI00168CC198|nr:tripartite motif-containing protein 6 isoform X2 [Oryzias melastigma]
MTAKIKIKEISVSVREASSASLTSRRRKPSPPEALTFSPFVNKVKHCSTQTRHIAAELLLAVISLRKENFHSHLGLQDLHRKADKMMQCFHFMVEPAKNLIAKNKEIHKKAKRSKKEPLDEDQLFVAELAGELKRVCQRSVVLEHIFNQDDTWPTSLCRIFTLQWANMLESKRPMQTDGWPEKTEESQLDFMNVEEVQKAKTIIYNWIQDLRAQPEQSVWPGEPVAKVLEDLESAWRWGRFPNLLTAMELVMWTLMSQQPDKDTIPQQWLLWKQRTQKIGGISYIPQPVWDWITDSAVEVTLDLDTANPDLLISADEKRMRCGFERKEVPNYHQRFDGWWCAVGMKGLGSGRHYWEAEVGERDWRLGVAKESALRKGFKSLNTDTGYLTLRLERGTELKALTVPFTALPQGLIPRKVGIYLDYDNEQLSFYDVEKRLHIYTYNQTFTEKLYPLFGTVEIVKDLVIRSPGGKTHCLCPTSCLWA